MSSKTIYSPVEAVDPDYSGLDSAEDIIRDAAKWGLLERLRELLGITVIDSDDTRVRLARDIAYEFAGAKNRDLAVDLFVHATGIAEYGPSSLRDYAAKHGCSHEWFRREADAMRRRLGLPERVAPPQRQPFPDADAA
jgi:hypothetical protein